MSETLLERCVADVRAVMEARGVSQSELARRLGRTPAAVSNTLSGRHDVGLGTLERYLAALGVRVTMVLDLSSPPASVGHDEHKSGV